MQQKKIPKQVSVWRHHFINTKIATLVTFFFVLLSFAMFSANFMATIIPKEYYIPFYSLIVILLSALYLKVMH